MTEKETQETEVNPELNKRVFPEGPLKQMLVEYVGEKLQPENDHVTAHMIVSVMAEEFPEFVLLVAEENYFRGYQQALDDIEKFNTAKESNQETQATEEQ